MVKVTAPLMSQDASGSLGKSIVFAKWKGRNYVRQLVTPSNPRTVPQRGRRAIIKFLAQAWAALTSAMQASYLTLAASNSYSTFNAYTSTNANRWTNGDAPQQNFQQPTTSTAGTSAAISATVTGKTANITATLTGGNPNNWGTAILRATAPAAPAFPADVLAILTTPSGAGTYPFSDANLPSGSYIYAAQGFNTDGVLNATGATHGVTIP